MKKLIDESQHGSSDSSERRLSKRLLNKNIVDFDGKPLIAHTIEAAIESGLFEDVVVSTDSEQIAEVALKYGAKVPFLRQTAADDFPLLARQQ